MFIRLLIEHLDVKMGIIYILNWKHFLIKKGINTKSITVLNIHTVFGKCWSLIIRRKVDVRIVWNQA